MKLECKNSKMDLKKSVEKFIDDPDQLIKYKKTHFKHERNTADIDDLIHKAIIKQKSVKRDSEVEQMKIVSKHLNKWM